MKSRQHGLTIAVAVAGIFAMTMSVSNAREAQTQASAADSNSGPAAATTADPRIAAARLDTAQRQVTLINQLADKFQGDAAAQFKGNFDALEWRLNFGARLFYQQESSLASVLAAPDINAMNTSLARMPSAKHFGGQENIITLLDSPCRIVDTRFGGGGMLGPTARFWAAFDTPAIIAGQGGNSSGCGSFPNAEFFLVYVTVVPPGAPLSGGANFLTLQHGSGTPTTSTMNYYPGINIANFATPSCQGCLGGSSGGFYAYASGNTHVVIDLVGVGQPATVKSLWAVVDADGTLARGVGAVAVTHTAGSGSYVVQFNQNVRACSYNSTIGLSGFSGTSARGFTTVVGAAADVNSVFVTTNDTAAATAERGFHLQVECP